MEKVMVTNDKYNGQYVAVNNIEDNTIVGAGNTPDEALKKAKKKGFKSPFLLYIPDKDLVHIYYVS